MPVTHIRPMHVGKAKNVSQAFKKAIDYIADKNKTDNGTLVTCFGCDVDFAHIQFEDSKLTYHQTTARQQSKENDVIGYSVIQSFEGHSVSPELANEIGVKTAKEMTKENHQFIVTTHVNTDNIHNHIIWNAVDLDCSRKWRNFYNSYKELEKATNITCLKNRIPIIQHKNGDIIQGGKSDFNWSIENRDKRPVSAREKLRMVIDKILNDKPNSFDELLNEIENRGYEVRRGKNIAFKEIGEKRFIRLNSLGEYFEKERLIKDIEKYSSSRESSLSMQQKENTRNLSKPNVERVNEYELILLSRAEQSLMKKSGADFVFYAKKCKLQELADAISYLNVNNVPYDLIKAEADEKSLRLEELYSEIGNVNNDLAEIKNKQTHLINFSKTRELYENYKASGYSKEFKENNFEMLNARQEAIDYFRKFPDKDGKVYLPKMDNLKMEYAKLTTEKSKLYSEYNNLKSKSKEVIKTRDTLSILIEHDKRKEEKLNLQMVREIKQREDLKEKFNSKRRNRDER